MVFDSIGFFLFFFIVVAFYFLTPYKNRWVVLLLASYYFIASAKLEYAVVLFAFTMLNYVAGHALGSWRSSRRRRIILWSVILFDIAVLFLFKYFNFFSESARMAFSRFGVVYEPVLLSVLLPLGISFYTFQSISYLLDVYSRKTAPIAHFGMFALHLSFFLKFVSGPIERSETLVPQFRRKMRFDVSLAIDGAKRFSWGLFKKMVVADRLAVLVGAVYGQPTDYAGIPLIIATVFFALQIYFDFSGYVDMAIGLARMLGIRLSENFNNPYFSRSIAEFWRRWHMTLSSWFRDYVYIPLGGSKVSVPRWCLNLFVVFLACGLWHGANWTFVVWGGLQASYMVLSRVLSPIRDAAASFVRLTEYPLLHAAWQVCVTFSLTCIGWIFFRADTLADAWYILIHLLYIRLDFISAEVGLAWSGVLFVSVFAAGVLFVELISEVPAVSRWWREQSMLQSVSYAMLVVMILLFGVYNGTQFIYAQF